MCIPFYVKLPQCSCISQIYCQFEGMYICTGYMCTLVQVKFIWYSGITQIYGQFEGVYIYTQHMCILLYVKLIQCSCSPCIYCHLEEVALVYVHFVLCETYMVQWYFIDLWSIGGYICNGYMCILLYVKLIWCSVITQIYGQLEEGALVYVHFSIYEIYLVQQYSRDLLSI